jgi:hypothetical protein
MFPSVETPVQNLDEPAALLPACPKTGWQIRTKGHRGSDTDSQMSREVLDRAPQSLFRGD